MIWSLERRTEARKVILEEIGIRTIMSSWPEFEITCAILTQICGVVQVLRGQLIFKSTTACCCQAVV
jgi:hypothetical protein